MEYGEKVSKNEAITLRALKKFKTYEISVLSFNLAGDGAASPQINCTTQDDSK